MKYDEAKDYVVKLLDGKGTNTEEKAIQLLAFFGIEGEAEEIPTVENTAAE